MAQIGVDSRIDNIERSLTAYIQTQIVTGLSLPMHFPRMEELEVVKNGTASRWGDASYIGLEPASGPMRDIDSYLMEGRFLCNINLFERDDHRRLALNGTTAYSLTTLADNVAQAFAAWTAIPIRNYAAVGTPQVGAMVVLTQPMPITIPTPEDLSVSQMNVSATMRYELEVLD